MNPDEIIEFDGRYYKRDDLSNEELQRIMELESMSSAAVFGKKMADFFSMLPALVDLGMMTQLSFRNIMAEDLEGKEFEIHKH